MKIFIRGGTWSNIEDQVLLAAYMKYGNNQWLRIASLLPRKSAQQVKARWEEYLDPSIRKTPWTQREDEKLLHFARTHPMQWRTIAQFFGRSAYQCLERYKELVDKASGTPHFDDNEAAVAHQMMPNYETLKPTPDAIELDQDEKEMLEEARARLANTQGKKARRKARERQLEVLRKVARMRKKRELDAAGLIIEEKNMWEDEEFELDPLTTHSAKDVRFDTTTEDKQTKNDRMMRIQKKAKQTQQNQETLDKLKNQLKIEKKKLERPPDTRRTVLILSEPAIKTEELKLIETLRRHDENYLDSLSSLSLFSRKKNRNLWDNIETEVQPYITPVVDKDLPRPIPVDLGRLNCIKQQNQSNDTLVEQLISEEVIRLSLHDAKKHPSVDKPPPSLIIPSQSNKEEYFGTLQTVDSQVYYNAEILINEELGGEEPNYDEFAKMWEETHPVEEFDTSRASSRLKTRVTKLNEVIQQRSASAQAGVDLLLSELNLIQQRVFRLASQKEMYTYIEQLESQTIKIRREVIKQNIDQLLIQHRELDAEYQRKIEEKKKIERQNRHKK